MSRFSKICFSIAGLLLIGIFILYPLIGWLNLHWTILIISTVLLGLAVIKDRMLYIEFFTMRTTKHGLSMGALILLTLVLLVCVNYLANKYNRTFDFTEEKLNSLSEQSAKVLSNLKDDITIKVFYAGQNVAEDKSTVRMNLRIFQEATSRLKVQWINSYEENALALEYLKDIPDRDSSPIVAFVEYKGKRIRISWPMTEEQITLALIKATRSLEKKIYFVVGHGERDLEGNGEEGLSEFNKILRESSFSIAPLKLLEEGRIPKDAAAVLIVGPKSPFLNQEIDVLREYALAGGRLLLAVDPLERHNLANLTKPLGVEFSNTIVISVSPRINGRGEWTIAANQFDALNEVTASFPQNTYVVMDIASQLSPARDLDADISIQELVKTSPQSFTISDPKSIVPPDVHMEPQTVAVLVKGQNRHSIFFGDSDFIANKGIMLYSNRDLILNSIASLTNEADLISIRPKLPKGTMVVITAINRNIFVIACISLPLILILIGFVVWFRRRGA